MKANKKSSVKMSGTPYWNAECDTIPDVGQIYDTTALKGMRK